jgi:hypothetical protein
MLPCCMMSDDWRPGWIGATRASSIVARTGVLMRDLP